MPRLFIKLIPSRPTYVAFMVYEGESSHLARPVTLYECKTILSAVEYVWFGSQRTGWISLSCIHSITYYQRDT